MKDIIYLGRYMRLKATYVCLGMEEEDDANKRGIGDKEATEKK